MFSVFIFYVQLLFIDLNDGGSSHKVIEFII